MILFPEQFKAFSKEIGSKGKNLKILQDHGFLVPEFIAVPNSSLSKIFNNGRPDKQKIAYLASKIYREFPQSKYAVRSNALVEDSKKNSYAGKFLSKIEQKPEDLKKAIFEILLSANDILKGNIKQFSLIIQQSLQPDFAGVTFTRNPLQGREMIFEYTKGQGEQVVSGKIQPERETFYWFQPQINSKLPLLQKTFQDFQTIEKIFDFPQDIEWCIQNDSLYFLQTRPITNISKKLYQQYLYLDQKLPQNKHFWYIKKDLAEITPQPTPFTLSLIEAIYDQTGPIANIYKKHGIQFSGQNIIKIIGNELYIDMEEEIHSILPAYSFFKKNTFQRHIKYWNKIGRTLKNILKLQKISFPETEFLQEQLQKKLSRKKDKNFSEKIHSFLQDYELIFEINLFAAKAVENLKFALKSEKIGVSKILSFSFENYSEPRKTLRLNEKNFLGNSLEIADESPFQRIRKSKTSENEVLEWFAKLSSFKKEFLKPIIIKAKTLNDLREYGRWLTVKNISEIREFLFEFAQTNKIKSKELIYFATLQECFKNSIEERKLMQRKKAYEKYDSYHFPFEFKSIPTGTNQKSQLGVSPGKAEGILVDQKNIKQDKKNYILYTQLLTPDLVNLFPSIKGIIAEQGGLLSHLAIVARENNIPVITNFDLSKNSIKLGDAITMEGETGEVKLQNF